MPNARHFLRFFKDGHGSDIQDQIVTKIESQVALPALSFDSDPSYNLQHDALFIWRSTVI
jgi:hypothetical protein